MAAVCNEFETSSTTSIRKRFGIRFPMLSLVHVKAPIAESLVLNQLNEALARA
jgi:hypothetical protein